MKDGSVENQYFPRANCYTYLISRERAYSSDTTENQIHQEILDQYMVNGQPPTISKVPSVDIVLKTMFNSTFFSTSSEYKKSDNYLPMLLVTFKTKQK